MHDDKLWVKGEGPTPNQQLPGHKYWMTEFLGGFFVLRTVIWRGTDPTGYVESCVKEWSQSRCSCSHAGSLEWKGWRGWGGRPDKLVFTCLGDRGPAS